MMDITWTMIVHVPELVELGAIIVAELHVIQEAINALTAQQAQGQEDLAVHLMAIEQEIAPTQCRNDYAGTTRCPGRPDSRNGCRLCARRGGPAGRDRTREGHGP